MAELVRACTVTILEVEPAGNGSAATAAIVDIPTQHTILLVDATAGGYQGIKFPEGNIGDFVEIYFRSGIENEGSRLRIYDADDNNLAATDTSFAMQVGAMISLRKILSESYITPSGSVSRLVGTWVGNTTGAIDNYPPA